MTTIGPVNMGNLTDFLFFFANGSVDANWQGATKGFVGDVAVDGNQASERTSGSVPYAGTISTNAATLGAWQSIVDQNTAPNVPVTQAFRSTGQGALISGLETDLANAFAQINALPATPGFTNRTPVSLDGLNTQNGIDETFVINIRSGFSVSSQINITGDAGDVYILRWDTDADPSNGYQGQVRFSSGGAIVPHGGLKASNFIHVAGDIVSSGGGSTPPPPYPQGPRFNDGTGALIENGQDFSGGGFFTGYWLTTGDPASGETHPLSNGIFVGGWYTTTNKFSMTSGTSGVYVSPNQATEPVPAIDIEKLVSVDGGATFDDADTAPGPTLNRSVEPNVQFKFVVTNTGTERLVNINVTDDVYGTIITNQSLDPGQQLETILVVGGTAGNHVNNATVTGKGAISGTTVTDTDPAHYFGTELAVAIDVEKFVSPDGGATYFDADDPIGPLVVFPQAPMFKFVVTNTGTEVLDNVSVVDDVLIPPTIVSGISLLPGSVNAVTVIRTGSWSAGEHTNTATATGFGHDSGTKVTDTDPAHWFGVEQATPSISLQKLISIDNGATFVPSNTSPGILVPDGVTPQFKLVVTNGPLPLTNVVVTDLKTGFTQNIPIMLPGEVLEFLVP